MSQITLTWLEFVKSAQEFLKLSDKLGDSWCWQVKDENEGNSFLHYKQKLAFPTVERKDESSSVDSISDICQTSDPLTFEAAASNTSSEYLQVEYHIVYSISYQVPVLYFQAHKSDGSLLQLEDAWKVFRIFTPTSQYNDDSEVAEESKRRSDMLSILTQTDHPVLFKPFLCLHPCRTAELLAQSSNSRNLVLTFISIMGPYVQLQLRNEYGLEETK